MRSARPGVSAPSAARSTESESSRRLKVRASGQSAAKAARTGATDSVSAWTRVIRGAGRLAEVPVTALASSRQGFPANLVALPRSVEAPTAIDGDRGAGDVGRLVAHEEQHRPGDLVRLGDAAQQIARA